ncbi:unnamed protein product [Mesocestoides corti]|uniref:Integrase n=1 Tax=Mesocestoides corti TaxID=53468 RepID=A0A0R3UI35_MESCO|nr:unnamed protein product [Mesocestoides corti]
MVGSAGRLIDKPEADLGEAVFKSACIRARVGSCPANLAEIEAYLVEKYQLNKTSRCVFAKKHRQTNNFWTSVRGYLRYIELTIFKFHPHWNGRIGEEDLTQANADWSTRPRM